MRDWVLYVRWVSLWGESISKHCERDLGWSYRKICPGCRVKAKGRVTLTARLRACVWSIPLAHPCEKILPACYMK